jgi:hypothetical protein
VIVIFVVDAGAARRALTGGLLRCPQEGCAGVLRPWASARARSVRVPGGGRAWVRPGRARCAACRRTQVLLPASCVPRRSCNADVIGAALLGGAAGLGHRKVAAQLQVPAATVRDWLRGLARGAAWLTAQAVTAGADILPAGPAPGGLAGTLAALSAAACSFARGALPGLGRPGDLTGIDYLGLLEARHRRELEQRLRVTDPAGQLAALPPWHVVNIITAGQLLTAAPGG